LQEAEDRMRPLSYPNTNVFLITFSFTDVASFANVSNQWIKELTHHSQTPTPFLLVGLKSEGEKKVSEEEVKALLSKTDKIEETFYVSCKQDKGIIL
jgi:GTPase SAR1 family protein